MIVVLCSYMNIENKKFPPFLFDQVPVVHLRYLLMSHHCTRNMSRYSDFLNYNDAVRTYKEEEPLLGEHAVKHCLKICGFLETEVNCILDVVGKFKTMDEFINKGHQDFIDLRDLIMFKQGGGWLISPERIRNLLALANWVTNMGLQGGIKAIDARYFTKITLEERRRILDAKEGYATATMENVVDTKVTPPPPPPPPKFDRENWMAWELDFYNYLSGIKSNAGMPLSSILDDVLRKAKDTRVVKFFDRGGRQHWPLLSYYQDVAKLQDILEEAVSGTFAQYKIKHYKEGDIINGLESFEKLRGWGSPDGQALEAACMADSKKRRLKMLSEKKERDEERMKHILAKRKKNMEDSREEEEKKPPAK